MKLFDKDSYLYLNWNYPTPLNLVAIALHFMVAFPISLWAGAWVLWAIKTLLVWPVF